jgi:hypothetical protein
MNWKEIESDVKRRYASGETLAAIASQHHVTKSALYYKMSKSDWYGKQKYVPVHIKKTLISMDSEIQERYEKHSSLSQIITDLDLHCSRSKLYVYILSQPWYKKRKPAKMDIPALLKSKSSQIQQEYAAGNSIRGTVSVLGLPCSPSALYTHMKRQPWYRPEPKVNVGDYTTVKKPIGYVEQVDPPWNPAPFQVVDEKKQVRDAMNQGLTVAAHLYSVTKQKETGIIHAVNESGYVYVDISRQGGSCPTINIEDVKNRRFNLLSPGDVKPACGVSVQANLDEMVPKRIDPNRFEIVSKMYQKGLEPFAIFQVLEPQYTFREIQDYLQAQPYYREEKPKHSILGRLLNRILEPFESLL